MRKCRRRHLPGSFRSSSGTAQPVVFAGAMPDLGSLGRFWRSGAVLLAGVGLALAGMGLVVAVALMIVLAVIGADEDAALWLTLYSLPIWGPIACAYLLQALPASLRREVWSS